MHFFNGLVGVFAGLTIRRKPEGCARPATALLVFPDGLCYLFSGMVESRTDAKAKLKMSKSKRMFAIVCLCVLASANGLAGTGGVLAERDFDEGRGEVVDFLLKRGYYLLADNQVTHCTWHRGPLRPKGPPLTFRQHPGIISIWTWPSGPAWLSIGGSQGAIGGIAAEFQLWSGDKQLPIELDESASQWRPHILHTEYVFPGGRLEQDLCIADDTVVCKLTVQGAPADAQVRIVGEPAGESGAEESAILDGKLILKNRGSLSGIWQVVAAPGQPVFTDQQPDEALVNAVGEPMLDAKQYEFRFPAQPQVVLAATLSRDRRRAIARVEKAMDDPDGAFQQARQRWTDFFSKQVPAFDCSDASLVELYYWIAYVLEADAYRNVDDPSWPYAYVVPSKWEWRGIWHEDLSHCLTGLRWFNDAALARDCLRTVHFRGRRNKPFDPKEASRDERVHAYGLTTMAAWALFLRTGDIEFLRTLFPTMCEMNRFEKDVRDDDDDGLTSMAHSFLLGWDSSLRFDYEGNLKDGRWFRRALEPVDANAYFLRESQILARMAEILGEEKIANEMSERAGKTKAALAEKMWDDKTAFFYDLFADSDQFSKVKSCAGFFPMLAGAVSPDRAGRLVEHLVNPAEFWTAYPVSCVARDEPAVAKARGGWTSATALRNNWLIVEGLARYGFDDEARELIWRTFKLLRLKGPHLVETDYYYDPDTGQGTSGQLNILFSTPIGGVFDFFLRRVAGVDPMEGRLVRFRPFALDTNLSYLNVSGLRYKGHEIGIRWTGNGEGIYRVLIDGELVLETADPHGMDVVYDLAEKRVVKTTADTGFPD